jgi:hypothetical protein
MPFESKTGVIGQHAATIVNHLDHCASRIGHKYPDAVGSGINSILNKFLNYRCGAVDHLSGSNLTGY